MNDPSNRAMRNSCGLTSLIIIQPTPFCNIDCSYCYLPDRSNRLKMKREALSQLFARLLSFPTLSGHVTIVWHAGEPMVLNTEFYETAFSIAREHCPEGLAIHHAIQTNGTLITEKWCDFIKRWSLGVGISVDGPKHIHDVARRTRKGAGTHDKTVAGMKLLQKREIPFYVISVLTKRALLEPDAMFEFYRQHNIHDVGFNIEEQEGLHTASSLASDDVLDIALSFFKRFSELMVERNHPIAVREFEERLYAIKFVKNGSPSSNQLTPFGIITIDVHGNLYTFSPELVGYSSSDFTTFTIGNIFKNTFEEMRNSVNLEKMFASIALGIQMCRNECEYFGVCGGGAPSNNLFENATFASTETLDCRLTKKLTTDFVLGAIESRLLSS